MTSCRAVWARAFLLAVCCGVSACLIELESPTGLPHAGNLALVGQLPQHDAADPKLAVNPARTARELATANLPSRELGCLPALCDLCLGCHTSDSLPAARNRPPWWFALSQLAFFLGVAGLRNGIPRLSSTARLFALFEFRKTKLMFMPCVKVTFAMLISGNTPCSLRPTE